MIHSRTTCRTTGTRLLGAATVVISLTACDSGSGTIEPPDGNGEEPEGLVVRALLADGSLAQELGWQDGIPGAHVSVHRAAEPYDSLYWTTAETDAEGRARFPDLLPGQYEILVSRRVSTDGLEGRNVVAGGELMHVAVPSEVEVPLVSDRRGSLVFSELALAIPNPTDFGSYHAHKAIEIYNNGSETVFLDGMIWGVGWHFTQDFTSWPCSATGEVRRDSLGIWGQQMFQFPGAGTEYPVAPGEVVTVARIAADHSEVNAQLPDLSDVDFEFGGAGSANNPDVPNLLDIGPLTFTHTWPYENMPLFLADPVELDVLPRYTDPVSGGTWIRIPAEAIHDAWVGTIDYTTHGYPDAPPPCSDALHPRFERLPGPAETASDFYDEVSMQRRVLGYTGTGQAILQDTNTSMADFAKSPRSLGWIADPLSIAGGGK